MPSEEKPIPGDKSDDAEDGSVSKIEGSSFSNYLRVFTYHDRMGWILNSISFVCMIAAGAILPLMNLIFGQFVTVFNNFLTGKTTPEDYRVEINKYALYFVYLFLAKFVLMYIWTVLIGFTSIRAIKRLRVDFLTHVLRQEIPYFDNPTSSIASQIVTSGNVISTGISEKLGLIVQGLSTFVAGFVVAFVVQWKLTLIVLAVVPFNIVVTVICVAYDTTYEHQMLDIYGKAGLIAEEAFASIRTSHAFWVFPKLSRRYARHLEEARSVGNKKTSIYMVLFPVEFFCIFSGYGLAFWQGIRLYVSGEVSNPGAIVTVIFAVLVAAQALTQIAPQTVAMSKATAAASDLFAIIDRRSTVDSLSNNGIIVEGCTGHIQLKKVNFAYPSRPEVPIFRNLSLNIPANKTTALVGSSGSGKSTIFGLLERWYTDYQGSITIDGRSLDTLNLQWLRTNIRLVQQEPALFSGSVYQNVVDGITGTCMDSLPEAEKKRLVEDACRAAYADEFIQALPQGYDTYVGERGASLSGGQKQRLAIARSIISNPKVLLLDEATSALDPTAEKIVQKALNNVAKGRTMIVIAHRLSTIQDADNIAVISQGQVVEQGSHQILMNANGRYAQLVASQDLSSRGSNEVQLINSKLVEKENPFHSEQESIPSDLNARIKQRSASYGVLKGLFLIIKEQKSLWWPVAGIATACLAGGVTFPVLAILFAKTMAAFQNTDQASVNFFALMFFVVALGNVIAYAFAGWLANVLAQHILMEYKAEIFDNTLRQDMTFFDKPENGTGALVSRLASEPDSLQELLSLNLILMSVTLVNLLSSFILAIAVGWKLGLVLGLGGLPLLVGSGYIRIRLEYKLENDTADRFATSSAMAAERCNGIRTVSSLALEPAVIQRYADSLQSIAKDAILSLVWNMFFYALSQSISFLIMGLGFWYGGRLVSFREYSVEQFYIVFIATIFSGQAAAIFFQYTTSISKARTAINYIFTLRLNRTMFDPVGTQLAEVACESKASGTKVSYEDVEFAYTQRPNVKALDNVSLDIQPGSMVALVGASGSGKSTMVALLERFYDPTSGHIKADNVDIKTLDRCIYRKDVALVQQEPVLYQGSIWDNITLGKYEQEPSESEIITACKEANIWDFISSLPDGLATPCGNQGLSLSGGQRQRLAIARALIRKPCLLLLDEATSALDTESEKAVKEALDRAGLERTTIAVAHRLSTIRDADMIVVFNSGKVVEQGKHNDLVDMKGFYYQMVLGQQLDRELSQ